MRFVDYLKAYVDNHAAELVDKSLYLLRNKSKVGMGFFEAGNFYPDYILWIDTPETQYISFIDPKGLMHIRPDDPKIEFYKTIKELETRLAPTADGKQLSSIRSSCPALRPANYVSGGSWNALSERKRMCTPLIIPNA